MKQLQRSLSLIVALLIPFSFCTAVSADELEPPAVYNQRVYEKTAELEDKYHIKIEYPLAADGYTTIGTASLNTLDTALGYLTPQVVRQVSAHYEQRTGGRLCFSYVHSSDLEAKDADYTLAQFDSRSATIEIYISFPGTSSIVTGNSPTAILHEFGHAFHTMYTRKYSSWQMRQHWIAINEGYTYTPDHLRQNPNPNIFMSGYAATEFEEDFAETFAYAFVCNRDGLGLGRRLKGSDGALTPLGRKTVYLEEMLGRLLENTEQAIGNLQALHSVSTSISYGDARLSGSYLEFIGYNPPHRVLDAMLVGLDLTNYQTCDWVREAGGWLVTDQSGNQFLVFPKGTWGRLGKKT